MAENILHDALVAILSSVRIPVVFDDCSFPSGGEAPGELWSEKSFANVSEVAGNSRIKR